MSINRAEFQIKIATTAETSGAKATEEALGKVSQAAKDASTKADKVFEPSGQTAAGRIHSAVESAVQNDPGRNGGGEPAKMPDSPEFVGPAEAFVQWNLLNEAVEKYNKLLQKSIELTERKQKVAREASEELLRSINAENAACDFRAKHQLDSKNVGREPMSERLKLPGAEEQKAQVNRVVEKQVNFDDPLTGTADADVGKSPDKAAQVRESIVKLISVIENITKELEQRRQERAEQRGQNQPDASSSESSASGPQDQASAQFSATHGGDIGVVAALKMVKDEAARQAELTGRRSASDSVIVETLEHIFAILVRREAFDERQTERMREIEQRMRDMESREAVNR